MVQRSIEHPARVTRVEGDTIVARSLAPDHPGDEITVWAPASLLFTYEGLIAKPLGSDRAQVLSIPFYRTGICLDDIVRTVPEEGSQAIVVSSVIQRSEFATIVLRLTAPSKSAGTPEWRRLMIELEGTGTWFDPMNAEQIAVAVPLAAIDRTCSILTRLKSEGLVQHWGRFDVPASEFLDELDQIFLD